MFVFFAVCLTLVACWCFWVFVVVDFMLRSLLLMCCPIRVTLIDNILNLTSVVYCIRCRCLC